MWTNFTGYLVDTSSTLNEPTQQRDHACLQVTSGDTYDTQRTEL